MSDRTILHCDCNSFFASVEETFNPALRNVPMAVAGNPETRHGIILAKNELAKRYKIQTAETVWSAKKKCPNLVLVPPRHKEYGRFCERVNAIYESYTPQVERFGIDESFLDLTGCLNRYGGDAVRCANVIRERVRREIGITISVGASWNKTFAKLGSDYKKPDAVTLIDRDNWRSVVFPLPVGDLFLVGKKTAESLSRYGVTTIGGLAGLDREFLIRVFGKLGEQLHINANGLDDTPVADSTALEDVKSVGNGFTFKRDLANEDDIRVAVIYLSDTVASRLRRRGVKCRTVRVTIRGADLSVTACQTTLKEPADLSVEIGRRAQELIKRRWKTGKPIRTLTITGDNLVPANATEPAQTSFFDSPDDSQNQKNEKRERLEKAIDDIRVKFGRHSVQPAAIVGNDLGIRESDNDTAISSP